MVIDGQTNELVREQPMKKWHFTTPLHPHRLPSLGHPLSRHLTATLTQNQRLHCGSKQWALQRRTRVECLSRPSQGQGDIV